MRPQGGDTITVTGRGVFEVMRIPTDGFYRFSDPYGKTLRVHTKFISLKEASRCRLTAQDKIEIDQRAERDDRAVFERHVETCPQSSVLSCKQSQDIWICRWWDWSRAVCQAGLIAAISYKVFRA